MRSHFFAAYLYLLISLSVANEPTWREGLQDLAPAWKTMLSQNSEARTAQARYEAQKENVASVQATRWPRVDFSSSYQYSTEVSSLDISLPVTGPGNPPLELHKQLGDHDRIDVSLLASYAVFTGFSEQARIESAKWQANARKESLQALHSQLGLRLVTLHWQIQQMQGTLALLHSQDSVQNMHVEHVQTLLNKGQATQAEVLSAEADQATEIAKISQQNRRLDSLYNEFNYLCGYEYPSSLRKYIAIAWRSLKLNEPAPQSEQIATARALTAQSKAMKAQSSAIGANAWPSLSLYAGWKAGNPGLAQATNEWMDYGVAGAQLQWNLFDGGVRRSSQSQVSWESRALQAESERVAMQNSMAWTQLSNEAASLEMQYQALLKAFQAAQKASVLRQIQMTNGNTTAIEVRDAQLQVLLIENQLQNVAIAERVAEARAHWLSGREFTW